MSNCKNFDHSAYWCYFHNVNFQNLNEPPSAQVAIRDAYNGEFYYEDLLPLLGLHIMSHLVFKS